MKFLKLFSGFPVALATVLAAQADVLISTLQQDVAGKSTPRRSDVLLAKDKLRLDIAGEKPITLIYRKDKDVFWMIDAAAKSYTEMTSKDLEEMGEAIADARKKMQEQLKNLPPEQQAMMEKMMGGMLAEPEQAKVAFKKGLGGGKVGAWTCQNWESYLNGNKTADHCVADYKSVGVGTEDFAVFKDMGRFLGKLAPTYKGLLDQGMNLDQLGGIPVETITLQDGKQDARITLESVKRAASAADRFELPAGLTKKSMPQMKMK